MPAFKTLLIAACLLSTTVIAEAQEKKDGLLERALRGEARIIDLSHPLNPRTPAFGGERDAFRYEKLADIDREGYASGAFRVPEHFGTHLDAPGHFIAGRETVDRIDVKKLIAPAVVIDIRAKVKENPDYRLTLEDLRAWERDGPVPAGAAVLLLTGWDSRWNDPEKYRNPDAAGALHFPGFSQEAIGYILKNTKAVALGIDTLSIDYGASKDFAGHKLSHRSGLYHVENMTNLDQLPSRGAVVIVAPLAVEGGSGSPARVLAIVP
jgi:kynurenine formamidase